MSGHTPWSDLKRKKMSDILESPEPKLDVVTAVRLAVAAVAARGADYVYTNPDCPNPTGTITRCYNWHFSTDSPGCIVGQIFFDFGVPKSELVAYYKAPVIDFHSRLDGGLDGPAYIFLSAIQQSQDKGKPWGRALQLGFEKLEARPSSTTAAERNEIQILKESL